MYKLRDETTGLYAVTKDLWNVKGRVFPSVGALKSYLKNWYHYSMYILPDGTTSTTFKTGAVLANGAWNMIPKHFSVEETTPDGLRRQPAFEFMPPTKQYKLPIVNNDY